MAEIEATRKKRKVLFAQPETPGERYTQLKWLCAFDPFIRFAAFVSFIVNTCCFSLFCCRCFGISLCDLMQDCFLCLMHVCESSHKSQQTDAVSHLTNIA